jgi:hypothetical protein
LKIHSNFDKSLFSIPKLSTMKNVLLFCATITIVANLHAQTVVGPLNGSTFTVVAISGSNQTWINPGNVAASDNTYATFGNLTGGAGVYTDYLQATGFNFSIPNGATISGIVVEVERSDPNFRTADYSIRIVKGGTIGSTDKSSGAIYPSSDSYQAYGNAGDLWGETWTAADINDPGFGVAIAAERTSAGGTAAGQVDNIRITVFYDFTILPVDLISFSAVNNNNNVNVSWSTANEINMNAYEVQRSIDGSAFSTIGTISSRNSLSVTQYNFTDNNPFNGASYYRLKMNGASGYVKYSAIAAVQVSNNKPISIYPNPVAANQTIHITNAGNEVLNIRLYDQSGRLVVNSSTNNDIISFPSLRSGKGIFMYRVIDSKGIDKGTGRLIIE